MAKLTKLIDPYIAMMVAVVALAAVMPAHGAAAPIADGAANAGIVLLFLLYGARLSPQAALAGLTQWRLQLAILACTFVLFPILGLAMTRLVPLEPSPALTTGILFLCLLPSTVQSSIAFTSIARGNVAAALCAASASNMLGVVVSPLLAGWLLHKQGFSPSLGQIGDIVLQLLVPFAAGQLLRPWIGTWVQDHKRILGFVDRGSILLIIYVAFSRGVVDNIWEQVNISDLLVLLVVLVGLLAVVLTLTYLLSHYLMRLTIEDEIVLQFCGSKKSLASGLPMAKVLFSGPQLGLIVLPLMLFHQIQLIVCAILARYYAMRPESSP